MADTWLYRFKLKIIVGLVVLLVLSMTSALLIIVVMARGALLQHSAENTRQLGNAITSSLRGHMLRHSPAQIQDTLRDIGRSDQIPKIFILNRRGQVAFSSDERAIGTQLDHRADPSCRGCHDTSSALRASRSTILRHDQRDVLRNVSVIDNEPACFGCHPRGDRINGKLIIDYSVAGTYALIGKIRAIILVSGGACLLFVVLFLSRMINRYIDQIILKNGEINLVYSIIDNISRTIDVEQLKDVVLDVVGDTLTADEVDLVLPTRDGGFRIVTRATSGEKPRRRKLDPDEPLAPVLARWRDGRLGAQELSGDGTEVYLPIQKGETRLALIAIRCRQRRVPTEKLKLVDAICKHIAIAFENARLYSIAITDELTGIFTVRHFRFCLDRQLTALERYGETFSLLMIDVDNFKQVNDTYGHPTGDTVLQKLGACIAESVRGTDLAFRYGGEEFAVILPATARPGALLVGERIRAQVEAADIVVDGQRVRATVSIGLAVCPDHAATATGLMLAADTSLYAAKQAGKNRTMASGTDAGVRRVA